MKIPPLREELSLHPGPPAADGSPTWTLHDPASNRFFRIGWREFELLSRWSLGDPDGIAASVAAETPWHPEPQAVTRLVEQLRNSHLVQPDSPADRTRFLRIQREKQGHSLPRLLRQLFFLRLPLWHPEPFLQRTLPAVRWLFTGRFMGILGLVAALSLLLISRQWEAFTGTFIHFFNISGMVYYSATLIVSKLVHELGHAYAAHLYGCRVPRVGVLWMVLWPRFYTDTSDVWKLASRRQRLVVGGAGMLAETLLASLASLAWSLLPDGPLRSAAFVLASSVWVMTLFVNLNPLLRFDGYFLLADAWEMADLQQRAFRMGRWQLREWLFGLNGSPPESLPGKTRRMLVLYAWAAWCYRVFLLLGAALLVYHAVFKLLGLLLLAAEIGWFLVYPIGRELKEWFALRNKLTWNRPAMRTTLLAAAALLGVTLPWSVTAIRGPALLQPVRHSVLYAPAAAKVVQHRVDSGQQVAEGELLLWLEDPDLRYRLEKSARQIPLLRWQWAMQTLENDPLERHPVSQEAIAAAQAEWLALRDEEKKLRIVAPFAGRVVDLARDLGVGDWVAKDAALLTVIGDGAALVKGYVAEADLGRVVPGASGWYYPEHAAAESLPGRVLRIDPTPTRHLQSPYLSGLHGGGAAGAGAKKWPVDG